MNPYDIIGVRKESSQEDIKKAYRKLSLKHHPDRNGNSDESKKMFQSISQAYIKLTECSQNDSSSFFGEANNSEIVGQQTWKPQPILITLTITLDQAYSGCMLPVEIDRWVIEGNIKHLEKETLYIQIPKGIDNNEILLFRNKGNVIACGNSGDVKIIINISRHPVYERKGLDLIYIKDVTLKEALCGVAFQILHISGKKYNVSNRGEEMIITPAFKRVISGLGLERDGHKGDLIIQFTIQFPQSLSKDKIEQLENIL